MLVITIVIIIVIIMILIMSSCIITLFGGTARISEGGGRGVPRTASRSGTWGLYFVRAMT